MTGPPARRTLARYLAFQIPGAVVAGIVLAFLHERVGLSAWAGGVLFALWIAKDAVLYPFVRRAYEPSATALDRLVGARGRVVRAFSTTGLVRVGRELWRAELLEGQSPVETDDLVIVHAARRLTLVVYRPPSDD